MLLKTRISRLQVDELAQEVEAALKPITIERGLDYYLKRYVYNVVINKTRVQATVEGTYRYLVNIDLANFHLSRCSCPVGMRCKHMAAVFFYLYALYDDPENFFAQLQNTPRTGQRAALAQRKESLSMNKPWPRYELPPNSKFLQGAKAQGEGSLETGSIEEWDEYLAREFKHLDYGDLRSDRYSLAVYERFLESVGRRCRSWGTPAKNLLTLHGYLFIMEQAEKRATRERDNYFLINNLKLVTRQFTPGLLETGFSLNDPEARKNYAPYYSAARVKLRQLLPGEDTSLFDWLNIYRLLWSYAFRELSWIKEESGYLDQLLKGQRSAGQYNTAMARAFLAFMLNDDRTAWRVMARIQVKVNDLIPYLQFFERHEKLDRLGEWLRWLSPRVNPASISEVEAMGRFWLKAAGNGRGWEEPLNALKSWLPKSSQIYAHSLIRAERYRTWVDFHIFRQTPYDYINREELKRVEAADPALLLPLYHHWAARLIEAKNRPAYKAAVKVLKKLRTCYRKLKRIEEWNRFICHLTGNYSRLRALQEELSKGKLLA